MGTATNEAPQQIAATPHTAASAARYCMVDRSTFCRWLKAKKIVPLSANGDAYLFAPADLDRLRGEAVAAFAAKARKFPMGVVERIVRENWPVPQRRVMVAPPTPQAFVH